MSEETVSPESETIDIPVCVADGDLEMAEVAAIDPAVLSQLTTMLVQSGNVAQNNFITVSKAFDYDHLEGKRVVDLVEALGAREVASKQVPAGPTSQG